MRDLDKMKETLEQMQKDKYTYSSNAHMFEILEKQYITSCGGVMNLPSKTYPLNSSTIIMGFTGDGGLKIVKCGDCYNSSLYIPKDFVEDFFNFVVDIKSQRESVMKDIENLRNEEAED